MAIRKSALGLHGAPFGWAELISAGIRSTWNDRVASYGMLEGQVAVLSVGPLRALSCPESWVANRMRLVQRPR